MCGLTNYQASSYKIVNLGIGDPRPPTVGNFWPPCGNSPTVQNAYILVQFVSKID